MTNLVLGKQIKKAEKGEIVEINFKEFDRKNIAFFEDKIMSLEINNPVLKKLENEFYTFLESHEKVADKKNKSTKKDTSTKATKETNKSTKDTKETKDTTEVKPQVKSTKEVKKSTKKEAPKKTTKTKKDTAKKSTKKDKVELTEKEIKEQIEKLKEIRNDTNKYLMFEATRDDMEGNITVDTKGLSFNDLDDHKKDCLILETEEWGQERITLLDFDTDAKGDFYLIKSLDNISYDYIYRADVSKGNVITIRPKNATPYKAKILLPTIKY